MIKNNKDSEIIVNSHFTSESEKEVALNMSTIIATLINRNLENIENMDNVNNIEEKVLSV